MFNTDCLICYDNLTYKLHIIFNCNHKICLDCNEKLENRICPVCRAEIPIRLSKIFFYSLFSSIGILTIYILKCFL
jgi:hypothetical protein